VRVGKKGKKFFELMLIDSGPHSRCESGWNSKESCKSDNKEKIEGHEIKIDRGLIGKRYQTIIEVSTDALYKSVVRHLARGFGSRKAERASG
jgi:hypothetical protein